MIFDDLKRRDRFIAKVYRLILKMFATSRYVIVFDFDISKAGMVVEEGGAATIKVNPLLGDRVLTLIHECIEVLMPDVDEEEVESLAAACYRRLTYEQEQTLLYYLREFRK